MGLFILLLLVMAVAVMALGLWVVVTIVSAVLTALVVVGGELLPVLMILAGIWLVWRAIAENRRNRRRAPGRADHQMHAWANGSPTGGAGAPSTARADRQSRGSVPATPAAPPPPPTRELPIDVQIKSEQIQRKADVLLGYADRFPPFSQSLHIVRQTAADYLPRTLEAYLALPGVSDPVVPITGRTALTELRAQLQLLDAKLDDITLDLQQQDLDRMSANRRFLEERFGVGAAADEAQPSEPSSITPPETLASVQPRASAGLGSVAAC
jgi:hypothetical protein